MEMRFQLGLETRAASFAAQEYPRHFRFLTNVIGVAAILLLVGEVYAQDRPAAQSPDHYTTTKTWIPTDALAINDAGVVLGCDFVIYKDRSIQLLVPFANGGGSILVSVNNRGQVLLVQAHDGLHYFLYDPIRKRHDGRWPEREGRGERHDSDCSPGVLDQTG